MSAAELSSLIGPVVDSADKFIAEEESTGKATWVMSSFPEHPVSVANKALQDAVRAYRKAVEGSSDATCEART
jgi:hypothetical protein